MWLFMTGFFSLNILKVHLSCNTYQYFIPFCGIIIFHGMGIPYISIHRLVDIWVVFILGLLWIMLLWTFQFKFLCGHLFPFLLNVHQELELLGHAVTLLHFEELPNHSPQWLHHFSLTPAVYEGSSLFQFVHILIRMCLFSVFVFIIAILMDVKWYLIVVLICIFLK